MALTKIGKEGITGISNASDATAITIDASENVGIGTASPATQLHCEEATTGLAMRIARGGNKIDIGGSGSGTQYIKGYEGNVAFGNEYAGNTLFLTGNTERMRIDSAGNVGFGGFTAADPDADSLFIQATDNFALYSGSNGTASSNHLVFGNGNSWVGSIKTSGSATSFNTSSDYRLKENVDYDWDATTRLKQLKPARFNFIVDDTNTLVDGFLAHEAQAIVPEAITGTKDEVNDNGDAVMQGIDQSKLVPLLVKTIQELEARLTAGGL
tara:strand:+ start:239 stop:1045 length:807 start_codon:yes stop_codon:yes gene_type:complete